MRKRPNFALLVGVLLTVALAAAVVYCRREAPRPQPAAGEKEEDFLRELGADAADYARELEAAPPEARPAITERRMRQVRDIYRRHGKAFPEKLPE